MCNLFRTPVFKWGKKTDWLLALRHQNRMFIRFLLCNHQRRHLYLLSTLSFSLFSWNNTSEWTVLSKLWIEIQDPFFLGSLGDGVSYGDASRGYGMYGKGQISPRGKCVYSPVPRFNWGHGWDLSGNSPLTPIPVVPNHCCSIVSCFTLVLQFHEG